MIPQTLKDVLSELIGEENINEFSLWAFGHEYSKLREPLDFAGAWNRLHNKILRVREEDAWVIDIIKMTKLWKQLDEKN